MSESLGPIANGLRTPDFVRRPDFQLANLAFIRENVTINTIENVFLRNFSRRRAGFFHSDSVVKA